MKRLARHLDEIRDNIMEGKFDEMVEEMMKNNDFDGDMQISEREFYGPYPHERAKEEL